MACLASTGRKLPCKDVVGGISKLYLANYGTLGTVTITAGTITAVSGVGTNWYQYDVKGTSNLEQTINSSSDVGTTFYDQNITLVLTKMDVATQVELQSVIAGNFHAFVQDNNGNYLAVGLTRGVEVTGGSITTGTALGDLNGYTLTLNGKEALMAPFVAPGVITSHASPTQITP
jgi:hypothetical protein